MRTKILARFLFLFLAGCSSLPMVDTPSTNQDSRINFLIIHFTSEHFAESMRLLAEPVERRVSVHYVVPEPGDETYMKSKLMIHRLVPEDRRARHAGRSYWGGRQSLNDSSVGIEIVNRSRCINNNPDAEVPVPEDLDCTFLEFPEEQLQLVIRLASDILKRNKDIDPVDVIGHGDIAPTRRVDPGPLFPWKRLYEHGIGAWYDDETVAVYRRQFEQDAPDMRLLQSALSGYGYLVEETGEADPQTRFALRAFQMHFRPASYTGDPDIETSAILFALLEKYRPEALRRLLQVDTDTS
jgi:N-acetylmuramoyl-L-alanine amidase